MGCASTGNLGRAATAAHAAKAGLPCYIFAPSDIEHVKIAQALSYGAEFVAVEGTYDDANRIASMIGDKKGIGVVNINMRPYYVEGSKDACLRGCGADGLAGAREPDNPGRKWRHAQRDMQGF